jgi:hypothetical protein
MEQSSIYRGAQVVYFSHGGGPLPILGDPGHQAMVEFMTRLPGQLTRKPTPSPTRLPAILPWQSGSPVYWRKITSRRT